jgi:hypothetical protein
MLLEGLDGVVHFGKEFVRYEQAQGGRVKAFFANGSSAIGDVLVGADGTGSKVRKQYLPQAQIVHTGVVGAACRLPLNEGGRGYLPEHLLMRLTSIVPPKGTYMIVTQSIHKPGGHRSADTMGDHVIWISSPRAERTGTPTRVSSTVDRSRGSCCRGSNAGIRSCVEWLPTPMPSGCRQCRC